MQVGKTDQVSVIVGKKWWAWQGLNLRPLRCQHSALPLSYTPTPGPHQSTTLVGTLRRDLARQDWLCKARPHRFPAPFEKRSSKRSSAASTCPGTCASAPGIIAD